MVALTRRKQAWVGQFKPDLLRGTPIMPNISTAHRYYESMAALIERMTDDTEKQLVAFFKEPHAKEYFAQDASVASGLRIITNGLQSKYNGLFLTKSKPLAEKAAKEWDKNSAASVQSSIQKLAGGLTIGRLDATGDVGEILTATIAENVGLIKSIASKYLDEVQGAVMRSVTTGNGLEDLVPFLKKYKGVTLRRAHLIALDQTRKATAGLSLGRLLKVGVEEGTWRHSGGSDHPRKTHQAMSGKPFKLSEGLYDADLKRFVQPAELPYCRCFFIPQINFNK